ncbi:hypothetical protein [Mycobacterium sp.]|uniref:hypothetical protein n=1 Tax=Mycobacterium sp. TaxID=1785 RepID=UPI003F94A2EF
MQFIDLLADGIEQAMTDGGDVTVSIGGEKLVLNLHDADALCITLGDTAADLANEIDADE